MSPSTFNRVFSVFISVTKMHYVFLNSIALSTLSKLSYRGKSCKKCPIRINVPEMNQPCVRNRSQTLTSSHLPSSPAAAAAHQHKHQQRLSIICITAITIISVNIISVYIKLNIYIETAITRYHGINLTNYQIITETITSLLVFC